MKKEEKIDTHLARTQRSDRSDRPSTQPQPVVLSKPLHDLHHVPLRPDLNRFDLFWSLSLDAIGVQTSLESSALSNQNDLDYRIQGSNLEQNRVSMSNKPTKNNNLCYTRIILVIDMSKG